MKFGGADGFSYMSISKDSPLITTKEIMSIHSERFFFPYIIGLFSKFLKIDFFFIQDFCFNNINNYKYFFDKDLKIFKFRFANNIGIFNFYKFESLFN